jgi:hypothetical protein
MVNSEKCHKNLIKIYHYDVAQMTSLLNSRPINRKLSDNPKSKTEITVKKNERRKVSGKIHEERRMGLNINENRYR